MPRTFSQLAAAVIISLPCLAASKYAAAADKDLTTLRAGTPKGEFTSSDGATALGKTEIDVRNVGDVDATGIQVAVELPDGQQFQLKGPETLGPNKHAIYSDDVGELITGPKKLKAVVHCSNCR